MTAEEIKEGNKLIAEFLGYKYYKKVLIDFSDCGGIYDWTDVYSKVPIEVDDYPEDEQCYFKDGWYFNNIGNFIYNPEYFTNWNELMEVINKIQRTSCIVEMNWALIFSCRICYLGKTKYDKVMNFYGDTNENLIPVEAVWVAVIDYIKYYNSKND